MKYKLLCIFCGIIVSSDVADTTILCDKCKKAYDDSEESARYDYNWNYDED